MKAFEITTKIIEEMSIKVLPQEENKAITFLQDLGFSTTNFDHQGEYTKVVGQRIFEPRKKG